MRLNILFTMAIATPLTFAMEEKKLDLIQQYHNFAFAHMNPTTQLFLKALPNDPKSKIINRYLTQLSFTALLYKQMYACSNAEVGEIPQEVRTAYRVMPNTNFLYHRIIENRIYNEIELLYPEDFNPMQAWKNRLEQIEEQIAKQLEEEQV